MKPGSWLEFSDYDPQKAQTIFSHGFVNLFIIPENSNQSPPEFPFLILIQNLDLASTSLWKEAPYCQGFIWRTHFIPKIIPQTVPEKLWIDFIVKDFKSSQTSFQLISAWPIKGYFVSFDEKIPTRKMNRLLNRYKNFVLTRPHDIIDSSFKKWEDLEAFGEAHLELNQTTQPHLSIVIPHYESPHFLNNVLIHLQNAVPVSPAFEVIVIDDGSSKETSDQILYFAHRHLNYLPVKFLRWKEKQNLKNKEKIFRAGASRNWGAHLAKAENIFFLDCDMLTPPQIVNEVLMALSKDDVIQFVRRHIPFNLSSETSSYQKLLDSTELYIEESNYWNPFFECDEWISLPDYWKYTCTYGLALKKEVFFNVGRIRRNFIRYGFEDTDLGYRLFKNKSRFKLKKMPLLHLTAKPDSSQNFIFKLQKMNRISPMAKTFYQLNLDTSIYDKFQSLLD